jgi:hypothetical protein
MGQVHNCDFSEILRTWLKNKNYDGLIRFFLLSSSSDLYMYNYNLDQENNLTLMVMGHGMVNCIINMYLFYLDPEPRYQFLTRRVYAGSVIAAGLATSIIGYNGTVADQDNNMIYNMDQDNNTISYIDIVVMIGALVLITLAFIEGFFDNSFSGSSTELEAILLIVLLGVFFYNSFSGSSTEIEENDKKLEFEKEEFETVGTLAGLLINRSTIDKKTGQKILFARIFGSYDGKIWKLTPLIVPCTVNYRRLWCKPLFSSSYVWLKYDKEEPYFMRYYDIVSVDNIYGSVIGYEL